MSYMNKKNTKYIPVLPDSTINNLPDFVVVHIRSLEDCIEKQNSYIEKQNSYIEKQNVIIEQLNLKVEELTTKVTAIVLNHQAAMLLKNL